MENEKLENQKIDENNLDKVSGGYGTQTKTIYSMQEAPDGYGTWGSIPLIQKLYFLLQLQI